LRQRADVGEARQYRVPVIPNEIAWFPIVCDMLLRKGVDVSLAKAKVDHIDGLFVWWESNRSVTELNIPV
jgi:hypothetical protein